MVFLKINFEFLFLVTKVLQQYEQFELSVIRYQLTKLSYFQSYHYQSTKTISFNYEILANSIKLHQLKLHHQLRVIIKKYPQIIILFALRQVILIIYKKK
ncbi:hypothetical protein pb186bvf_003881 [Paramecium bursaria]